MVEIASHKPLAMTSDHPTKDHQTKEEETNWNQ